MFFKQFFHTQKQCSLIMDCTVWRRNVAYKTDGIHCSLLISSQQWTAFLQDDFPFVFKTMPNGFKTFKLIDPFLFWTNISYVAPMHCLSSNFPLHPCLSLFQATSFLIIVFYKYCWNVQESSQAFKTALKSR